jgi:hypothetical protein
MLDHGANVPVAIQEPVTIESLRRPMQRTSLFEPSTDVQTILTESSGKSLETDFVAATGRMQSGGTLRSGDPASTSHIGSDTVVDPEPTDVYLDKQPTMIRCTCLESQLTTLIEEKHDRSTPPGRLDKRSMLIGPVSESKEDDSDDDVYLSAEEGEAEIMNNPRHETSISSMPSNPPAIHWPPRRECHE